MLKILLVDDESIVIEGVQHVLKKFSDQCQVVGAANNSYAAFDLVRSLKPDVVITDIKMPDMTGIELLQRIKEDYPDTYVVLLSGYAEFELARDALKLGAYEYLLKPCKYQKIAETLTRIGEEIRNKEIQNKEWEEIYQKIDVNQALLHKSKLKEVLLNLEYAGKPHLEIEDAILVVVEGESEKSDWGDTPNRTWEEFVQKVRQKRECQSIVIRNQHIAVFQQCTDHDEIKNALYELKLKMNRQGYIIYGVISGEINSVEALICSYKNSQKILEYLRFNQIVEIILEPSFQVNYKRLDASLLLHESSVVNRIMNGDLESVTRVMEKIRTNALSVNLNYSPEAVKVKFIQFLVMVEMRLNHSQINLESCIGKKIDYIYDIENIGTLRDLLIYVEKLAFAVTEYVADVNDRLPKSIQQAVSFISSNYHKELSLNDVAQDVYLNPWYFSELFKESTGMTFTEYLTFIRIEKAKELLRSSKLKNYEIADKVGFMNASYFSVVFKKIEGVSPKRYRKTYCK